MKHAFFILPIILFFSCKKENVQPGESVEIYLLKTVQTIPGKCQVDPSHSSLKDTAIIRNRDILYYSAADYNFKLTDTAIQKVKALMGRTPFAVTVDRLVIYYGFYMPMYLSSSCDQSITMDIDWTSGNKIYLRLGYPGQLQGITTEDNRNDPKLLSTLKLQGKLR
jgi:hypothetical protein